MPASRTLGRWLVLTAMVLLLGPMTAVQAKKAIITMRDGRVIEGDVVRETPDAITLDIQGIETTLPRKDITNLEFTKSLLDEYKERKAGIKPDQKGDWYALARWLYDQNSAEADQLAQTELKALLAQHPNYQAAQILLTVVEKRQAERNQTVRPGPVAPPPPGPPPSDVPTDDEPLMLTKPQAQLLKVYEVDLSTKPRVIVPQPVADRFYETYRNQPVLESFQGATGKRRFLRLEGYEQLSHIFQARARDLYDQVIVRDEPNSLKTFRSKINPLYLARYCGACHGKPDSEKFYVFTERSSSESAAYSNFLILNRATATGENLIDYTQPRRSLLVQYGLPSHEATTPHPEVPGRRPYYTGLKDKRIEMITNWIQNDLNRVTPLSYPIEYEIPQRGPQAPKSSPPADKAAPKAGNG